jgi:peptidoglycan L-alanyl-D-glutamate endopeptidase CwlK
LEITIRWGGAWDILFTSFDDSPEDMVSDYIARRKKAGKKAFIDGPHYELPRSEYPGNA